MNKNDKINNLVLKHVQVEICSKKIEDTIHGSEMHSLEICITLTVIEMNLPCTLLVILSGLTLCYFENN